MGKNVPIAVAAKLMGKSQQYIRVSLQRNSIPIGNAEMMPDKTRYDYYISPKLLSDYTGIPVEIINKEVSLNE